MAKYDDPYTLRGKDAIRFVNNMIKEETNPDKRRIRFLKKALKMRFVVHQDQGIMELPRAWKNPKS